MKLKISFQAPCVVFCATPFESLLRVQRLIITLGQIKKDSYEFTYCFNLAALNPILEQGQEDSLPPVNHMEVVTNDNVRRNMLLLLRI